MNIYLRRLRLGAVTMTGLSVTMNSAAPQGKRDGGRGRGGDGDSGNPKHGSEDTPPAERERQRVSICVYQ